MSIFAPELKSAWQQIIDDSTPQRPTVGKTILVTEGKHKGKEGLVTWHGCNRFSDAWRYCDNAQGQLRDIVGRYGYRVRVQPIDGDAFFVDANKVEVI